ncbi:MAG: alpha/beta hydrolase, partial [Cyanobacteria bacterium J06648_11]
MVLAVVALVLSGVGCFLSAWVVVPAPTFALLPLSVGAPEIAPWLSVGNGAALLLAVAQRGQPLRLVAVGLAL